MYVVNVSAWESVKGRAKTAERVEETRKRAYTVRESGVIGVRGNGEVEGSAEPEQYLYPRERLEWKSQTKECRLLAYTESGRTSTSETAQRAQSGFPREPHGGFSLGYFSWAGHY